MTDLQNDSTLNVQLQIIFYSQNNNNALTGPKKTIRPMPNSNKLNYQLWPIKISSSK